MTKREAIMRAATELFARKGYKGTAVSEIAGRADVAQGTVFHHFKSKENLLISICDELVRSYIEGIRQAADGPGTGWDALQRVVEFNRDFKKDRFESITVAFRETKDLSEAEEEVHDHFCGLVKQIIDVKAKCLEKGIEDGSIRQVPVRSTALLVHFLLVGMFHIETEGLIQLPELDSDLLDFCRRSLAAQEAGPVNNMASPGG